MNWDAVGAVAEGVGAAGVIATLFYLASQIRANTNAVKASVTREANHAAREFDYLLVRDPELMELFTRGFARLSELSPDEQRRLGFLLQSVLRDFECQMHEYRLGLLDAKLWGAYQHNLKLLCAQRGFRTMWDALPFGHDEDFRALVESHIPE